MWRIDIIPDGHHVNVDYIMKARQFTAYIKDFDKMVLFLTLATIYTTAPVAMKDRAHL